MKKIFNVFLVLIIFILGFVYISSPIEASTEPELPRVSVDTSPAALTGKTIQVSSGSNLQAALDSASYGDEIVLESGARFVGSFILRKKSGQGVITVRSSDLSRLPLPGTRVDPSRHASAMAKVLAPGKNQPALSAENGASGYRIVGIEFGMSEASGLVNLVFLGGDKTPSLDQVPSHIILDRVYAHGDKTTNLRRCIVLNGADMAVIDSYVSDCHEVGADSQAIAGWNGPGPFKIVNNYLEGAGENLLFGGADPSIKDLVPSDIEIRKNHFFKPLSWKVSDPSYAGKHWSVKNLFETKNARRVLVDGNVFENNWVDGQTGVAILFKSANQNGKCPWCISSDIIFSNNIVKNAVGGFTVNGSEGTPRPPAVRRIKIKNVIFDNISDKLFQIFNGASDVILENVTAYSPKSILFGDAGNGSTNPNLTIKNSVMQRERYGVGAGSEEGSVYLGLWFPGYSFDDNVLINTGREFSNEKLVKRYPGGTRVISGKNEVPTGVGADMAKINAAIESVTDSPIARSPDSKPDEPDKPADKPDKPSQPDSPSSGNPNSNPGAPIPPPSSNSSSGGSGGRTKSSGGGGSSASSAASSAKIAQIQAQLTSLLAELAKLKGASPSPAASVAPSTAATPPQTGGASGKDLTLGSSGLEVAALQQMLVTKGHLVVPPGVPFGYFGPLTQAAVARWQRANGVSPAAGYWGPISRSRLR